MYGRSSVPTILHTMKALLLRHLAMPYPISHGVRAAVQAY